MLHDGSEPFKAYFPLADAFVTVTLAVQFTLCVVEVHPFEIVDPY